MRQVVPKLDVSDYLEILRRRVWGVLACLLVGLVGAGVVFLVMPKSYRSSTLILVESQKVPTEFIKPVTVDTIEERLITIQQQIFSRTLLQKIIDEFGLYKDDLKSKPLEDVIEDMRKVIKVTTVDDRLRRNIQAFTISYDGDDPLTAMKVTNKMAAQFIEENLKVREQLVEGTTEFLDQELQSVKEKLDPLEKQISDYRSKYIGQLPQQLEPNLRTLDRLQSDFQNMNEAVRMAEEKREILRDTLNDPTGAVTATPGGPALPQLAQLRQLQNRLLQLSEYKDTYPDVIDTKRQIQELETQLAGGAAKGETGGQAGAAQPAPAASGEQGAQAAGEPEGASTRNFNPQLRAVEAEITARKYRLAQIGKQIKNYEHRIAATAVHEQHLSILQRDYENLRRNHEVLLNKKTTAKASESLEKRQKGEQFRILDPANLPVKPVKPDPLKIFLGGFVVGLALAGGSIWWIDLRNTPFRRPEEVEAALECLTLATLPLMSGLMEVDTLRKASRSVAETQGWRRWVAGPARLFGRIRKALPWSGNIETGGLPKLVVIANLNNALGAEQFRVLAGRVLQLREKKGQRIIAITSALVGEGKSTMAMGLAVTLARDFLVETILIDGDMRNPTVSARLGRHNDKGLVNVLAGECDLDAVLCQHAHRNLRVLCAGKSDSVHLSLPAMRGEMQKLLDGLRHRDVLVILDGPPILPMADMNLYAEIVDGILLVVRAGQTPQRVVIEALDFLAGRIEGVVLNGYQSLHRAYYTAYASTRYALVESPLLFHRAPRTDTLHASRPSSAEDRTDI